jgi:hypothetical protein
MNATFHGRAFEKLRASPPELMGQKDLTLLISVMVGEQRQARKDLTLL